MNLPLRGRSVMTLFLDRDRRLLYEHVSPDGSHPDCFEGRLINPGHGIEAMWFIMDIARRRSDQRLVSQAVDVILSTLAFGWDDEYGGIYKGGKWKGGFHVPRAMYLCYQEFHTMSHQHEELG
jgi:N-acylglucosamine 2-epimerase